MDSEAHIQAALRRLLESRRWLVEVTHGNRYQTGFPDLFVAHAKYGARWIDCKRPQGYALTKAQRTKWPRWESKGVGIWILTAASEAEYAKLFDRPNWRDYWRPKHSGNIEAELRQVVR